MSSTISIICSGPRLQFTPVRYAPLSSSFLHASLIRTSMRTSRTLSWEYLVSPVLQTVITNWQSIRSLITSTCNHCFIHCSWKTLWKCDPPEKICALPIAYRTYCWQPTLFAFAMNHCPENDPPLSSRFGCPLHCALWRLAKFTRRCKELGLKYMGICLHVTTGNAYSSHGWELLGKKTDLSRYQDHSTKGTDHVSSTYRK